MQVPSHQIHNVLKVYSKHLSQARAMERRKVLSDKPDEDKISLSAGGKRKAIIEKVAADIVDRITRSGPQDKVDQEIVEKLEGELGQPLDFNQQSNNLVFNVIGKDNEKTTATLQVDDPEHFMKRLEALAKEAVDKNMEL
jgi:hypothetical protein